MKNRKFFYVIIFGIIALIVLFGWKVIQIGWVELFKMDATFVSSSASDKGLQEVIVYKKGRVFVVGHIKDGIKQETETMYSENGNVKSKTLFVNGLPRGKGYLYTDEGKLQYSGYYLNGNPYGGGVSIIAMEI